MSCQVTSSLPSTVSAGRVPARHLQRRGSRPQVGSTDRTEVVAGRGVRTVVPFVTLALLWGGGFSLIKVALTGLTPGQLVLARLLLGAAALTGVAVARRVALPRGGRTWLLLTVAGLLGNVVPFLLLSYGELSASAGVAGTLVGATPLITVALAAVALRSEHVTGRQLVGMVAGFVGVVVVLAPWQGSSATVVAAMVCFGAAVSYAGGFVFVRRYLSDTGLTPLSLAAGQLLTAAAVQSALTPALGWQTPRLDLEVVAAVTVLGIAGTGLAYLLYFTLIDQLGASGAASVDYLVPVVAVAVGIFVLREPITWHLLAGGILVLAGVAYTQLAARTPQPRSELEPVHSTTLSAALGTASQADGPRPARRTNSFPCISWTHHHLDH